jgi:hypothetical protein
MTQDPEALVEGFNEQLRGKWVDHRRQAFNSNTKGAAYENALADLLKEYFGGIYDIRTRTAVIDEYLECFDVFSAGTAEFDVVANFSQAVPRVILESGDMKWVPYDGTAFICEVKSEINTSKLEDDLAKLAKLKKIEADNQYNRFPNNSGGTRMYTEPERGQKKNPQEIYVNHQLKCLVYDECSISESSLREIAETDTEIWDLILIADENILYVSPELPFVDAWIDRISFNGESFELPEDTLLPLTDGFVWFIIALSVSIPRPRPFDVTPALLHLVQRDWLKHGGYFGFGSLNQ